VHSSAVETAKFLVDNGAEVNASAGISGSTALQGAARMGNHELLRYFLDLGADVNAAPAEVGGMTALEAAAGLYPSHYEKQKIFHLLVGAGARLNRAEPGSKSLATTSTLLTLIKGGSVDLARFAINAGADIRLKTTGKEGRTPLQLAAERGQLDIVTALQACAIRGRLPIALLLLESGADVNAKSAVKDGRTAIEGAAEHGRLDMVQLLIDAGSIGDLDTGFRKALDAAERNSHFTVADMLKEHQRALDLFPMA
jgi:ankyrin repeat protein